MFSIARLGKGIFERVGAGPQGRTVMGRGIFGRSKKQSKPFTEMNKDRKIWAQMKELDYTPVVSKDKLIFSLAVFCSFWGGAILADTAPQSQLLKHHAEVFELLASPYEAKIENALDRVLRATWNSHSVKRVIFEHIEYLDRLIIFLEPTFSLETRGKAAKIIENITSLEDLQAEIMQRQLYNLFIEQIMNPYTPLYIKKTMASALAHLANNEDYHQELAEAGAVTALALIQTKPMVARHQFAKALQSISTTCLEQGQKESFRPLDWKIMKKEAKEFEKLKDTLFYRFKNPLVESGLIMYLHTAAGGAIWGFATGVYQKASMSAVLSSTLRTSLVTGLVPAYFVGLCTGTFTYYHQLADTDQDLFKLYAGAIFGTTYPWFYLLPLVESFSPLWVGGHVVGFGLFFTYLVSSKHDILRSDKQIQLLDEGYVPPAITFSKLDNKQIKEKKRTDISPKELKALQEEEEEKQKQEQEQQEQEQAQGQQEQALETV